MVDLKEVERRLGHTIDFSDRLTISEKQLFDEPLLTIYALLWEEEFYKQFDWFQGEFLRW